MCQTLILFCANRKQLIKRYPDGNGLNYLVKGSFAQLSSRKDLEDVKAFFETKGEFPIYILCVGKGQNADVNDCFSRYPQVQACRRSDLRLYPSCC